AIELEQDDGTTVDVPQHDGSVLRLHKLDAGYDPRDRIAALNLIHQPLAAGEVGNGLPFVDHGAEALHGRSTTVDTPLNPLRPAELAPGATALAKINAALR